MKFFITNWLKLKVASVLPKVVQYLKSKFSKKPPVTPAK